MLKNLKYITVYLKTLYSLSNLKNQMDYLNKSININIFLVRSGERQKTIKSLH